MKTNFKVNNFLKNNSSTILTVIGSVGVGLTAIFSARDTVKAVKRIEEYELNELGCLASTKEKIRIAAPCYIPTIISGLSTILCICSANKINKNVQKSLTGAYVLLDRSFKEYRDSVKETYGENGEKAIVKNIAEKNEKIYTVKSTDEAVFFDFYSLQFFNSTLGKLKQAEDTANDILRRQGYISLEMIHSLIGENTVGTDGLLGWSLNAGKRYGYNRIEFETYQMAREDGTKYYVLDFIGEPTEDYLDY